MQKFICYFDGACEPMNPGGNMGIGACVFKGERFPENDACFEHSNFVPASPKNSNNVAEYMAFEKLLDWTKENVKGATGELKPLVHIYGDSKLVIYQMLGAWKIKGGLYVPFAQSCRDKLNGLRMNNITIQLGWIPRDMNSLADRLSKKLMVVNGVEFRLQKQDKTEEILSEWKKDALKDENGNSIITPSYIHARPKQ